MKNWRIFKILRGWRGMSREEDRAGHARDTDASGRITVTEVIDRALADAGAIPWPPMAIDPAQAVSAGADSFLGRRAFTMRAEYTGKRHPMDAGCKCTATKTPATLEQAALALPAR